MTRPTKDPEGRPHTELRRQDGGAAQTGEGAAQTVPGGGMRKPLTPADRLPGGDEDDLFNDLPV